VSSGNCVVGDYEACLPIDESNRSAKASSPESAAVRFAGVSGIPQRGQRARRIDLLGGCGRRVECESSQREEGRVGQAWKLNHRASARVRGPVTLSGVNLLTLCQCIDIMSRRTQFGPGNVAFVGTEAR
jgi:hypothetical protein